MNQLTGQELSELIIKRFNLGELKTLAFDIGLDYEMLPGEGKAAKARELVLFVERRGRLQELSDYVQAQRPFDFPEEGSLEGTPPTEIGDVGPQKRGNIHIAVRDEVVVGEAITIDEELIPKTKAEFDQQLQILMQFLKEKMALGELPDKRQGQFALENLEDVQEESLRASPRVEWIVRKLDDVCEILEVAAEQAAKSGVQDDSPIDQAVEIAQALVSLALAGIWEEC